MFTKKEIALAKDTVEAIKKISKGKWKWKPKPGDRVIWGNSLFIYMRFGKKEMSRQYIGIIGLQEIHIEFVLMENCVPLLHWERIVKILQESGYSINLTVGRICDQIEIWKGINIISGQTYGGDPQLAVMQAVIELEKGK